MPRPRQRATLESGLKLDVNHLIRKSFIGPGSSRGSGICWTDGYSGEEIASGWITADMTGADRGWLRIRLQDLDQTVTLMSHPRHFGGRQWYFVCPRIGIRVSVLWMPPGAQSFASRQRWGRSVAYATQFMTPIDRAHRGKHCINRRLCIVGSFDPDEWDFPPKPKWMRWNTYNRAEEKFDQYEALLDRGTLVLVAKFMARQLG